MSAFSRAIAAKTQNVGSGPADVEGYKNRPPITAPGMNAALRDATRKLETANARIAELEAQLGDGGQPPGASQEEEARRAALQAERDALARDKVSLNAEIEVLRASERVQQIPLAQLHLRDEWRRKLSDDEYAALRENLRNNPLDTPVSVRPRAEGGYEVIAGSNRVSVFRELGREAIDAVVRDVSDDDAERRALYSNLLSVSLPAFQKFRGLKRQIEVRKISQALLAEEAGISEKMMSLLMSFDRLPEAALSILTERPDLIGAGNAAELARIADDGASDRVVQALTGLADGSIKTVKDAVAIAKRAPEPVRAKTEPVRFDVKRADGKSKYCAVTVVGKSLRLDFANEKYLDDSLARDIRAFIEARAKQA